MWRDHAIRGLRKPSEPWAMLCMGYTHAHGLLLRTRGRPIQPEIGGYIHCAKKWDERTSADMEFPSSPFSSICWPRLSAEEATLRGRLKWQFRLGACLALSTSPTQILPIVIIVISSELPPVRNIGRKMMCGCNVMSWYHMHLVSPPYFSLICDEKPPCFFCASHLRISQRLWQGRERSRNVQKLHVCVHACVSIREHVCTPMLHTSAAQSVKLILTPQASHGSSFTYCCRSNFLRQDWFCQ